MKVGVPREIKTQEYRVGLTPMAVREYAAAGHEVVVQAGAGEGIGAADAAYVSAGARIVDTAKNVFQAADMIVKVKEPQPAEWKMLREGKSSSLTCTSHPITSRPSGCWTRVASQWPTKPLPTTREGYRCWRL